MARALPDCGNTTLVRLAPLEYVHILDRNTNATRLEVGPRSFLCLEHERVVLGPRKMLVVPPRHFLRVANPVVRAPAAANIHAPHAEDACSQEDVASTEDENGPADAAGADEKPGKQEEEEEEEEEEEGVVGQEGEEKRGKKGHGKPHGERRARAAAAYAAVVDAREFLCRQLPEAVKGPVLLDACGQARLRHGDAEIRFEQSAPFPLYPGERLLGESEMLRVVPPDTALRCRALRDFEDLTFPGRSGRRAGEEWLYRGPSTFFPQVEVDVLGEITATVVLPSQALRLRALRDCRDCEGVLRLAGEEWLVRRPGAYLPDVAEEVVGVERGLVLTDRNALHLRARSTFIDVFGVERKVGEEWLLTAHDTDLHIAAPEEEVVEEKAIIALARGEWCVVRNPVDAETREIAWGHRRLVTGEKAFFLQPGEVLETNVRLAYVLGEDECLVVRCIHPFEEDQRARARVPGERWFIFGPREYIPPLEVQVLARKQAVVQLEALGLFLFFWRSVPLHRSPPAPRFQ